VQLATRFRHQALQQTRLLQRQLALLLLLAPVEFQGLKADDQM
jgi:hypothetical protein